MMNAGGIQINFWVGHLDRMPRCEHGRVICRSCEEARDGAGRGNPPASASPRDSNSLHGAADTAAQHLTQTD